MTTPSPTPELDQGWFIVRSATRQEPRAAAALEEAGFAVYYPQLTRLERLGRTKDRDVKKRPLLMGYLFVEVLKGDFAAVEAVDGVHAFLRYVTCKGEWRPRQVPDSLIEAYRDAEAKGLFDERFKVGATGRILDGPWRGHVAEIVEMSGDQKVKVFLALFGRMNKVTLDVAQLEPA